MVFAYIYHKKQPNVGLRGSSGLLFLLCCCFASSQPIRIVVVVGQGQWGFYLCGMSDLSCP